MLCIYWVYWARARAFSRTSAIRVFLVRVTLLGAAGLYDGLADFCVSAVALSVPRAAFTAERRVTLRAPCMHVGKRRGAHVARREEKHDINLL